MPNYKRTRIPGCTVFFTVNAYQRQTIFTEPLFRSALRKAIQETRLEYPFDIDAWVLLPNHLHCIWTLPENDSNTSIRWSMIKRLVSQQIGDKFHYQHQQTESRHKRKESTIWQRRFWEHHIIDNRDFITHLNYCYWNPVKHGEVKSVHSWPYSTFHRDVKRGLYPVNWCENEESELSFGE